MQVENIALLNNAKDLGFVGVNMYVDDEGGIKGAPPNMRASQIAACCGKPLEVGVRPGVRGRSAIQRSLGGRSRHRHAPSRPVLWGFSGNLHFSVVIGPGVSLQLQLSLRSAQPGVSAWRFQALKSSPEFSSGHITLGMNEV